ncbi:MAG TPA: hypothetical protein VGC66_21205 [Pyrinomonadaceae bacterium]|jgi:hypothetical protein
MKIKLKKPKRKRNVQQSQELLAGARQFMHPAEFRIAPPVETSPDLIEQVLRALISRRPQPQQQQSSTKELEQAAAYKELSHFVVSLLADVGTGLWRMRQKMVQPGTNLPQEEMRRAFRHLESTWDVLAQSDVQIIDHTGEAMPEAGVYSLKVLAYEPTPGLRREKVVETIKPTIYFRDQMIQMGEVIVGTPPAQQVLS